MARSDRDLRLTFPCPLCGNGLTASVCVLGPKPYVMDITGCAHAAEYAAGIANEEIVAPIDRSVIGMLGDVVGAL